MVEAKAKDVRENANQEDVFKERAFIYWNKKTMLYYMNAIRVPFIRDGLLQQETEKKDADREEKQGSLTGYKLLDIGCGVGLLSEALAELGAKVIGVDPVKQNTEQGTLHATLDPKIQANVQYVCGLSNDLLPKHKSFFHGVVASEVIEHVDDPEDFVKTAVELTKENGSLFFTTINRTWSSYLIAIFAFERVLKVIPRGIHDWNMFVPPEDLSKWLEKNGCEVKRVQGFHYNPWTKKCTPTKGSKCWYALHAVKINKTN